MNENVPFKPVQLVGPRGGNLEVPYAPAKPEWRKSSLNTETLPDGSRGAHRFLRDYDTAAPGLKNEQQWHTMAAYMLNAGRTNSEIALAAGVSVGTVSHLRSQRWFQEKCAILANENGEELLGAIKSHALDAVEELARLMLFAENESVRRAAARDLLEQAAGKPTQKIISSVTTSRLSAKDEMDQLDLELAALREHT